MTKQTEPTSAASGSPYRVEARTVIRSLSLGKVREQPLVLLTLFLIAFGLYRGPLAAGAEPYVTEYDETSPETNYYLKERYDQIARERQELFRKRVVIADAVRDEVYAAYAAQQRNATAAIPPSVPFQTVSQNNLLTGILVLLAGVFVVRKVAPEVFASINKRFNPWAETAGALANIHIEDSAFSEFLAVFRSSNSAASDAPAAANALTNPDTTEAVSSEAAEAKPDPLEEFFTAAPGQVANLRHIFSGISRAADDAERHNILLEFHTHVSSLKDGSRMPELRPFWLVACALEGLLKQLCKNSAEVTPSVLGTAAGAVDLLEVLALPGVNPKLATEPPVKLLAVDDDPVSRLAISFALKKAFNTPDLAPDGPAALELIAQQPYDVIFLDVDMPGMDGYELCMKIHQNELHRTTPVVFVTRHSDFQSRAKSTLSGGQDLIAKPFLAFEITVKALTLALRGRLQNRPAEPEATPAGQETLPAIAATASELASAIATPQPDETPAAITADKTTSDAKSGDSSDSSVWELSNRGFQALFCASREDTSDAFFTHAPACLDQMRHLLQAAQSVTVPDDLQKPLGHLLAGVRSINAEAERAELRTVSRLATALEGLLKKMCGHARLCTPSTFAAVAAALDLLEELCDPVDASPNLTNPPVNILVVDDDPVARRAISMAVQLLFGRPDNAGSGEAAVALAAQKSFDLILLDVLMPGMDGFAACRQIHETESNHRTPVVFITSHDDAEARSKAVVSGGCGFVPKPVLASQVTLIALTYIIRARYNPTRRDREVSECLQPV